MTFLSHEWIVIPLFAFCIFLIVYMWSDKIFNYFSKRSTGQREEILRMLDLMFVEFDQRKVTILLTLLSLGLGTVFFLLFLPNVLAGLIVGAMVTVAGWTVPTALIRMLFDRRCTLFVDQMVDGLTIMANGIKSGLSVPQAMERVVDNLHNP